MTQNELNGKLVDFFRNKAAVLDNVPENFTLKQQLQEEAFASLILNMHSTQKDIMHFRPPLPYYNDALVFSLPRQFCYEECDNFVNATWYFYEFEAAPPKNYIGWDRHQSSRWQLYVRRDSNTNVRMLNHHRQDSISNRDATRQWEQNAWKAQAEFERDYANKCKLFNCKPSEVFKCFRYDSNVYLDYSKALGYHPYAFHPMDKEIEHNLTLEWQEFKDKNKDKSEDYLIQLCLQENIPCDGVNKYLPELFLGYSSLVFPIYDEIGDNIMITVKLYDVKTQQKTVIPVTCWRHDNSGRLERYALPFPSQKQKLNHLHILKRHEHRAVILCDNEELAYLNQTKASSDFVFVSYRCRPGDFDHVDWAPLQGENVYLLITNHSGVSLTQKYIDSEVLVGYLKEKGIELKFIQQSVRHSLRYFNDTKEVIKSESKIEPGSVKILESWTEFDQQLRLARAELTRPAWWEVEAPGESTGHVKKVSDDKRSPINYVSRPMLIRGEVAMLYAGKGTGKSALALSIAAAAIKPKKKFLLEKWWGASTRGGDYTLNKGLYLDFENGAHEIEQRKIDFCRPYWGKNIDWERNLIIKDMLALELNSFDYSQPENQHHLFDMIDDAKHQGISGQPIDFLVIDTVSKFTRNAYNTSDDFIKLLNRLRKMKIAVLLVHHANNVGEVRGKKVLMDDLFINVFLSRNTEDKLSENSDEKFTATALNEPMQISYVSNRGFERNPDFKIFFDKKWKLFTDGNKSSKELRHEELCRLEKHFKTMRLDDISICDMLGICESQYHALKNTPPR